jgi:hypothetical protein
MTKLSMTPLTIAVVLLTAPPAATQVRQYPLESPDSLILHNVACRPGDAGREEGSPPDDVR